MVLHFQPALPCAQLADDETGRKCGVLTTTGVVSPDDGDVWEFLPLCRPHYQQAANRFGPDVGRMTPADVRDPKNGTTRV